MGSKTTFERLGGFARVRLIVSDFYEKVLESPRLARHFAHTDMRRLIDHQTKFMAAIMGGPAAYSDEQMARAHLRLGITGEEFDELAELLRETLEDVEVPERDIERLCAEVMGMRRLVVAGPEAVA
jgi:hemoglobin